MRNSTLKFIPIGLLLLLTTCSPEIGGDDAMRVLNREKDSLKNIYDNIGARISELDAQLAELDTSAKSKLMLVTIGDIEPKPFQHFFEVYGEVHSDKNVAIYPETMGVVTGVNVKEGDKVVTGQIMAKLDNQVISNQIKELETSYDLAKLVFEKQERLWQQNIGSEIQFLEAKNRKESIESSLTTLKSQQSKATITAPFSGIVDEIFLHPGEMATGQVPLLRLVNTELIYLKCDVSEQHLNVIKRGTEVEVLFSSTEEVINAKVSEVGSFINPENRTFKLKIDLSSAGKKYKPNLLANVKIKDYEVESAFVVSSTIIQQSGDGSDFIYLIEKEGDKYFAKKRIVQTGNEYQGNIEILSGLEEGDTIIKEGARSVRDGQRVRIQIPNAAK